MMESQNWPLRDRRTRENRRFVPLACEIFIFIFIFYFLFFFKKNNFLHVFARCQHFGLEFTKIQSQALLCRRLSDAHFAIIFPRSHLFPFNNCVIAIIGTLKGAAASSLCVVDTEAYQREQTTRRSLIYLTYKLNQWWSTEPFCRGQIESVSPTKAVAP